MGTAEDAEQGPIDIGRRSSRVCNRASCLLHSSTAEKMPFSYLQQQQDNEQPFTYDSYYTQDAQQGQQLYKGSSSSSPSAPPAHHAVQGMFGNLPATAGNIPLQLPSFLLGSHSTLAAGGGAEVLPAGLFTPGSWFNSSSPSTSLYVYLYCARASH